MAVGPPPSGMRVDSRNLSARTREPKDEAVPQYWPEYAALGELFYLNELFPANRYSYLWKVVLALSTGHACGYPST
jgi:hypothetical protein